MIAFSPGHAWSDARKNNSQAFVDHRFKPGENWFSPADIFVIDGDTISARGRVVRLVGFDAPETGNARVANASVNWVTKPRRD